MLSKRDRTFREGSLMGLDLLAHSIDEVIQFAALARDCDFFLAQVVRNAAERCG